MTGVSLDTNVEVHAAALPLLGGEGNPVVNAWGWNGCHSLSLLSSSGAGVKTRMEVVL